jgi:hypothetical protein
MMSGGGRLGQRGGDGRVEYRSKEEEEEEETRRKGGSFHGTRGSSRRWLERR